MELPSRVIEPGSDAELQRFRDLQEQLKEHFLSFRADPAQSYSIVVIPSQSFDAQELAKIDGVAHYEERSLFNLMLLRRPRLQIIYVTSKRLNPAVIDYYLHQMRSVPPSHARSRLQLLDCDDASPRPLTEKILERPRLIRRIADVIPDPNRAHLVAFNSSHLERTLAVRLGIPLNACDPDLTEFGTKTGARRVFKVAGLPIPVGREGISGIDDLVDNLADLWEEKPEIGRVVVKLDDSFAGEGNGVLDLSDIAEHRPSGSTTAARRDAIRQLLPKIRLEAVACDWESYASQFESMGGICEQWIEGPGKVSPSVQLRINPLSEVQCLSTHDQALGGPNGQIFRGATFPAGEAYRLAIQDMGRRVGSVLAARGVMSRFGVDFVVLPSVDGSEPRMYALEINLRQGGTTHPFNTLKLLTGGHYDPSSGLFFTSQGQPRAYFATDVLSAPQYRGLLPSDLIDLMVVNGIHFRANDTGVVFHLLGCLSEFGKLGCTAVAEDVPKAMALYDETLRLLNALSAGEVPGRPPMV